jgi:cell division protein FtsI (penicillin-binding protein 3)
VLTVPDRYRMSNKVFKDSHDHPTERMTVTGVLVESSNVGTIQIAEKAGGDGCSRCSAASASATTAGSGLPGESPGIVPDPDKWWGPTLGALAIGQSYSVNAVQAASVYATVANDGVRITPTVVRGTADETTVRCVRPAPPEQRRVLSPELAGSCAGCSRASRRGRDGGGRGRATATAWPARPAPRSACRRRYDGSYTASFVGFAPADDPGWSSRSRCRRQERLLRRRHRRAGLPRRHDLRLSNQQVPPTGTPAPRLRLRESDPR